MNALLPLAVVALAGTATFASAEDAFPLQRIQDTTSFLHFDHLKSSAPGVVEVYDYDGHATGRLLGVRPVAAGTNQNLRIIMNPPPPVHDVIAVLVIDGVAVADQVAEFDRTND